MTKELLEQRIKELESQKDLNLASANACAGAIEECKLWLSRLDSNNLLPEK